MIFGFKKLFSKIFWVKRMLEPNKFQVDYFFKVWSKKIGIRKNWGQTKFWVKNFGLKNKAGP